MLIYADPKTSATVEQAMLGLEGLQGRDLLIARGMLEQGLADAGFENGEALPNTKIELKTPEGFAFYQLYPEQYRRAAQKWLRECKSAGPAIVIGIRSIGTTLSHVVWEELRKAGVEVSRCTVRPQGDPFQRRVKLPDWVTPSATAYLVVDEGPGLSGSSFGCVAAELERRGVERNRIHFFPGHPHDPGSAASEETRKLWRDIARWNVPPETPVLEKDVEWKYIGPALPWPFDCSGQAERNARRSSELSFGLPVLEHRDWWLSFPIIQGHQAAVDPFTLAAHIVAVADEPLRSEDEIETEYRLREMLLVNVEKYFRNKNLSESLKGWLEKLILTRGSKSSGDGELGPGSWIRALDGRLWKKNTQGSKLSHFVAYRLPVWWDVAQAIVEWEFSATEEEAFLQLINAKLLLPKNSELEFFKMAVAALGLGKSVMLQQSPGKKYEHRVSLTLEKIFGALCFQEVTAHK